MDHYIRNRLERNGNPMQGLVDGELSPAAFRCELDDECGVWTVTMQLGWYCMEALIERGPDGLRTAGPGFDTWIDDETVDLLCLLPDPSLQAASAQIERAAIEAVMAGEMIY